MSDDIKTRPTLDLAPTDLAAATPSAAPSRVPASELEWRPPPAAGFTPKGLDVVSGPCIVFPEHASRTADKFLFLREIGGTAACLHAFLQAVNAGGESGPHWGATLIIDDEVVLTRPLTLPSAFTLAGVGMHGRGRLRFIADFGEPAITFFPGPLNSVWRGKATIRDLAIEGPGAATHTGGIWAGLQPASVGIHARQGNFDFHRISVSGFKFGISGGINGWTATVDGCHLHHNKVNLQLVFRSNSYRIRDCLIENALEWGIDIGRLIITNGQIFPPALTHCLISGCRFRNNRPGAIQLFGGPLDDGKAFGVMIFGNFFRSNSGTSVRVGRPTMGTRIVGNYFDEGENIMLVEPLEDPDPRATHIGFNVSLDPEDNEVLNTLKVTRVVS